MFGALASLGVTYYSLGRSEGKSRTDREADTAERRADAANQLVSQWIANGEKIATVGDLLQRPDKLGTPQAKNQIIFLGNWYDQLAHMWSGGRIDSKILEDHEMRKELRDFWQGVENLKQGNPPIDFSEQQSRWPQSQFARISDDVRGHNVARAKMISNMIDYVMGLASPLPAGSGNSASIDCPHCSHSITVTLS